MVRDGEMTEKAFFALKTQEARDAFKWAGGMKGNGLNPTAWNEATSECGTNWDELTEAHNIIIAGEKRLGEEGGRQIGKDFFALKTQEARDAFKWAGGKKGNGLDPTAWNEATSERGTNWDELTH